MHKKKLFGSIMLITGCCIGSGMIGLPILSKLTGFIPTTLAMILCYAFTTITGLLLLEATLWFDNKVNLPSIAEYALGKTGKLFTMLLFTFLFYCIFVAYLDAGGSLFAEMLSSILPFHVSHIAGTLFCMGFVFAITYAGTAIVDKFNSLLLIGLIASYFLLIALGIPKINKQNLLYENWSLMFNVIPLLLICFGFQNLVPSITYYLNKDAKSIRLAIIIGNFIPFIVYFFWNFVIIGLLSNNSLTTDNHSMIVTELLQTEATSSATIVYILKSFSICAILTSFLPSAISFVDFLKDGFSKTIKSKAVIKSSKNQILTKFLTSDFCIYLLVFMPSTIFAIIYPRIFLSALGFAGGFIDVLLFGFLPAAIIIFGRKLRTNQDSYRVFGNNFTPIAILVISIILLLLKITNF
jgi:tyrosine-specific transport protein